MRSFGRYNPSARPPVPFLFLEFGPPYGGPGKFLLLPLIIFRHGAGDAWLADDQVKAHPINRTTNQMSLGFLHLINEDLKMRLWGLGVAEQKA